MVQLTSIAFLFSSIISLANNHLLSFPLDTIPKNNKVKLLKPPSKVLYTTKVLHPFSDINKKNSFCLTLTGKSVVSGKITFEIYDFNKRLIHNESFDASGLLGDEGEVIPVKVQPDTIITRMKRFFNKENFIKPAIKMAKKFDPDYSDKIIWSEINSNKSAIGFLYAHGYEGSYAIAYSRKNKKAVCYYSSD